jgi:hypothetical protein
LNAYTQAAGFENAALPIINNEFAFNLPENVRTGNYGGKLVFNNWCNESIFDFSFTLRYPSDVIAQRWNDVIAVKNYDFNGGYDFSAFQWYKNNTEIPGATQPYYTESTKFDFSADYSVALTRSDDDVTILTCSFTPEMLDESNILVYPSAVSPASVIKISIDRNVQAIIYNSMGVVEGRYELKQGDNTILSPPRQGIYVLQFVSAEGESMQTYKITVK